MLHLLSEEVTGYVCYYCKQMSAVEKTHARLILASVLPLKKKQWKTFKPNKIQLGSQRQWKKIKHCQMTVK